MLHCGTVCGAGVDWSKRGAYMRRRHGVTAKQADEALADPNALVFDPDYASTSGRSVRTIGWSGSADRLLTVITLSADGTTDGVNGWPSNYIDSRHYREHEARS